MPTSFERDMEIALTSMSTIFSLVNEVLTITALVHLIKSKQKFHRNHIVLRYNFVLGCFCSGTGTLVSSIFRLMLLNGFQVSDLMLFRVAQTFESIGPNMFRLSFVCFMLERAIATQASATYEKNHNFRIIGPILVLASILFAGAMSVSYNLFNAPIIVLYSIYIALDILSLMCALILNAINQKLLIINERTDLRLSSRYQITENIRVFKFLYKIIITGIFIAALCTTSSLTIRAMTLNNYKLLARISYFGLWNIYGCIGAFLLIKDCSPNSMRCCKQKRYQPVDYTSPIIRNVHGKRLAIGQTIDGHFKALQEIWSNNCAIKDSERV